MAGGRPTSYSQEMQEKAEAYLASCEEKGSMPQLAQMAYMLDISRKTLYNWGQEHEEFLHVLEKTMAFQEFALVSKGLAGDFNSTITKLMLTKHGYRESSDITTDGKALPTPILGAVTKEDVSEDTSGK